MHRLLWKMTCTCARNRFVMKYVGLTHKMCNVCILNGFKINMKLHLISLLLQFNLVHVNSEAINCLFISVLLEAIEIWVFFSLECNEIKNILKSKWEKEKKKINKCLFGNYLSHLNWFCQSCCYICKISTFFLNSTSKIILADCEKCVMGSLRHLVIILTTNQIRNAFFLASTVCCPF